MGMLDGKRALIVGLASNRSIAWGIAKAMQREGAELAFTFQNDKLRDRVEKLAADCGTEITVPCDVSEDEEIEAVFDHLDDYWDHLDIIVHSVAYAPRTELEGDYLESVSREGFRIAHEISSYSFSALAKAGYLMMKGRNAAIVTMSYLGAVRTVPNYNVMGVAKASLEANVRYLADSMGPEGVRVNAVLPGVIETEMAFDPENSAAELERLSALTATGKFRQPREMGPPFQFLASKASETCTGALLACEDGVSAGFSSLLFDRAFNPKQ